MARAARVARGVAVESRDAVPTPTHGEESGCTITSELSSSPLHGNSVTVNRLTMSGTSLGSAWLRELLMTVHAPLDTRAAPAASAVTPQRRRPVSVGAGSGSYASA